MKKSLQIAFILLSTILWAGCDPCRNVACGNGLCNGGECICDTGYEKDINGKCEQEIRAKFLGTWTGDAGSPFQLPLSSNTNLVLTLTPAADILELTCTGLIRCDNVDLPLTLVITDDKVDAMKPTSCGALSLTFSDVSWRLSSNEKTLIISFRYLLEGSTPNLKVLFLDRQN